MSAERDSATQAKKRLEEISTQAVRLKQDVQGAYDRVKLLVEEAVEQAQTARGLNEGLSALRAEAEYLQLSLSEKRGPSVVSGVELHNIEGQLKKLRSAFRPVHPPQEWLEKIRQADQKPEQDVLSPEERIELLERLKSDVCPVCVSFALDGSCTVQSFEKCPIEIFLNRLVQMIQELGHRPWMEDYFNKMYREICPGCEGRRDGDYCPPREEGECAVFSYLPSVVKTIETFMKERAAKASSQG